MRYRGKNADQTISTNFVAGTYVVLMGFEATEAARKKLLGFAVHRADRTENEQYWLQGFRTFEATLRNPPPGTLVSTQEHPVQDFLWSDFTAKPGHDYVYKVVPVYGQPKNLDYGEPVEVDVTTEKESDGKHEVYFNRGVIGSQAYAREFHNIAPDKLKGQLQAEAYAWLSRGLKEAMLNFIAQANAPGRGLRAAVYEFSYEPAVEAFGTALKKCKDVKIVYDARIASGAKKAETQKRVAAVKGLLKKYGLSAVSTPRTASANFISHNKFIVLMEGDQPAAVWTGSTNFTESGIFGQSNVGHVVRDPVVAQAYLDYWQRLQTDPAEDRIRSENETVNPEIQAYPPPPGPGVTPIFSPRKGLAMLQWYAGALGSAQDLDCLTAAFGVNKVFLDLLKGKQTHLHYLLLEQWGVKRAQAEQTKKALGAQVRNQVAVGGYLEDGALSDFIRRRWLVERNNPISVNVRYTHNKFLLVDPLSGDPVVVTGSANFSNASTTDNDENMLVIRGDKRVADIYLGEFMRLWRHYRFRSIVNKNTASDKPDDYEPNYLDPTPSWTDLYYKDGTIQFLKRRAFA